MNVNWIFRPPKKLMLVFLFLLVVPNVFISASTHRSRGGDFRGFLIAGDRFLQGEFLYKDSAVATNVTWPLFFAVFIVPFTLLSKINLPLTQVLWYLLSIFLFFVSIGIWVKLLYGTPCGWLDEHREPSLFSVALIIPLLCVSGPLLDNFTQLQTSPLLLWTMSMGVYALHKNRQGQAGIWFGLAAALKAFPVLFLVYLLYRRRFRATLSMVVTCTLATLLPIARYGFEEYISLFHAWINLSLSGGYPLGGLNQSVYAMIGRYTALNPFEFMSRKLPTPLNDSAGIIAATWIFRALLAGCLTLFFWLLSRKQYRNAGVESAFFIVLMTVFSPISWRHYYVLLLPAWMIAAQWWQGRHDRALKAVVIGSGILISGLYLVGQIGKPVSPFLLCVMSNFTLGTFVLLTGLLYIVARNYGDQKVPKPEGSMESP